MCTVKEKGTSLTLMPRRAASGSAGAFCCQPVAVSTAGSSATKEHEPAVNGWSCKEAQLTWLYPQVCQHGMYSCALRCGAWHNIMQIVQGVGL